MQRDRFGHFARSLSGHDAGSWYVVVGGEQTAGGERVLVADGALRRLGNPKAKNPLHLRCANAAVSEETQRLIRERAGGADEAIKRELERYRRAQEPREDLARGLAVCP